MEHLESGAYVDSLSHTVFGTCTPSMLKRISPCSEDPTESEVADLLIEVGSAKNEFLIRVL